MANGPGRPAPLEAAAPILVILISVVIGAGSGSALVALSRISTTPANTYCPFNTGSGMEFPRPGPTGNVSPNATSYYANGSVLFTATASGCVPPYSFTWVFGDGTQSNVQNLVHVYPGPGYYSGSLTVHDSAHHSTVSYLCINASAWPNLAGASGSSPPSCP